MFQVCKKIYFFFLKIVSYFLFISALTNFLKIWAKNKNTDGVIVISLTEHIGDIIASEPISRYFKNNFNNKIVWVVNKRYSDFVRHNPTIDHLICVDSMSEWTYLKRFLNVFKIKIVDFKLPSVLENVLSGRKPDGNSSRVTVTLLLQIFNFNIIP